MEENLSLKLSKHFLGKNVEIVVDRPLASLHPEFDFVYEVNYGHIEGVKAPDGDYLDAYCLGWDMPLKTIRGRVVAIVHRPGNDDDKLVVVSAGFDPDEAEILKIVDFQEKWFKHAVVRS